MILSRLFEKRSAAEDTRNIPGVIPLGGAPTSSGAAVNETTALSLTAVWLAIRKLSTIMGIFPLPIYRNAGNRREKNADHPLYKLLHDKPNPYMTAFNWRFLTMAHELTWGAGVSEIEFNAKGEPVGLWPLAPWMVRPAETPKGDLIYEVTMEKGPAKKLHPWQLLIFPFYPTLKGGWLSPVKVHSETLGSALAVRQFGAKVFGQGVNPAGVISGGDLGTEESQESYEKRFEDYAGLGSSHRLLFLYGAEKFERVGLPPEDAQYLQTRQFDIAEIARIYDIPTFMLHDHDKTSSWAASVTAMEESFINLCMLPHCIQWEQELNTKLLDGGDGHYCKFTIDGLLRGNVKDRAMAYKTLASIGVYTVNDILELEERNPIAEDMGNARLVPLNMAPLDKLVSGEVKSVDTKTEN